VFVTVRVICSHCDAMASGFRRAYTVAISGTPGQTGSIWSRILLRATRSPNGVARRKISDNRAG
jgi:hypothetical protein